MRDILDKLNKPIIKEGGNVFSDTDRIPTEVIKSTVQYFKQDVLDLPLDVWLGTTGQKNNPGGTFDENSSGDLDISVDETKFDKKEVFNSIRQWAIDNGYDPVEWVFPKKGVTPKTKQINVKVPMVNSKGQHIKDRKGNPGYVQLDLMFGHPEFQKFSLRGEPAPWKGQERHVIMANLAKAQGLKWSFSEGLSSRSNPEQVIKDPQKIVQTLTPGYSGDPMNWHIEDIFRWAEQKYGNQPDKLNALFGEADATLQKIYNKSIPLLRQEQDVNENAVDDINFLAKLRDRIVNQGMSMIIESAGGGRPTQHIEDLVIFEGIPGLRRAIEILKKYADGQGHDATSLKWDGSPAIVFGRDELGRFTFAPLFAFKNPDKRSHSVEELGQQLAGKTEPDDSRKQFIAGMQDVFRAFESATPSNFKGYMFGDLMYTQTPPNNNGHYVFQPNKVEYSVVADSDLGKNIGRSKIGIAIHKWFEGDDPQNPVKEYNLQQGINSLQGTEVLAIPPIFSQQAPDVDTTMIDRLEGFANKYGSAIQKLMDPATLEAGKMKRVLTIFYDYLNAHKEFDPSDLGHNFVEWLPTKVSAKMSEKIIAHVQENKQGFDGLFKVIRAVAKTKNNLAQQLDQSQQVVKQNIANNPGRGEGYVVDHPQGSIKLVPRNVFSAAPKSDKFK